MSAAIQTAKREVAIAIMNLLVADKAQIDYQEFRPMRTAQIDSVDALMKALANRVAMDCSESTTLIFHIAGLKDPCGQGYDGYGNTSSMLNNSALVKFGYAKDANPCALAIFNANLDLSKQHVAVCHTADPGGNPLMFTHGHQGDPTFVNYRDLKAGFSGKTQWLGVQNL